MKKSVYLFELDSVRYHPAEVRAGQMALFGEIIHNGHTVVLTFNQLVDSNGFFSFLDSSDYFENLVKLFECGAIKISQYNDIRTISQYMLDKLDARKKETDFIFSAWPLKLSQRRLVALLKRSLMYSDLSEIFAYIGDGDHEPTKSEEELRDLFIETYNEGQVIHSNADIKELKGVLEHLYYLLRAVLRLSTIHTIYVPPRDKREYKDLKFHNILKHVLSLDPDNSGTVDIARWSEATEIIRSLDSYKQNEDGRTNYIRQLREYSNKLKDEGDIYSCCYAEAIINLVYNYACEISICDVSKHYDVGELRGENGATFANDFFGRLSQYWDIGYQTERFLSYNMTFGGYEDEKNAVRAMAEEAARITNYVLNEDMLRDEVRGYEYKLSEQRQDRKERLLSAVKSKSYMAYASVGILVIFELVMAFVQGLIPEVNKEFVFLRIITVAIISIVFLVISEFLTDLLSKHITIFEPLSESVADLKKLRRDRKLIIKGTGAGNLYFNNTAIDLKLTEPLSRKVSIDFIVSTAVKRYIKLKEDKQNKWMFTDSSEIPIAESGSGAAEDSFLKSLTRCEEVYGRAFGVVYQSEYNTLIVDPIETSKNGYFKSYERVIPSAGNGVVMITMHKGKFVLIRQFRHAPRKEQWCFPRGHGENNITDVENAKKEAWEEIGAVINKDPVFLGRVSPDSGLAGSCASVYLVDVDHYDPDKRNEGILEIREFTETEFTDLILKGNSGDVSTLYDDGYTLAAYTLYNNSRIALRGMKDRLDL